MKKVVWGVISTANIGTAKVIPALQKSPLLEVRAIDFGGGRQLSFRVCTQCVSYQRVQLCGTRCAWPGAYFAKRMIAWSSGNARVARAAGVTGATASGVPFSSASSKASVPGE